ncbi:type IX secretion system anionic LPS delivery protein PorZ [Ekhidna sp.]
MKRFAGHAFLRHLILSSLLVLTSVVFAFSQNIAVGTWRTHFSYSNARFLEVTPDKIFCATQNGLFSREISSGALRRLSKIDGLSDVGVSALAYDEINNVLVIGYGSGFVDFVFEDQLLTISDIATSNLDIDKTINDIAFGSPMTYLATDLGVIVVNTSDVEVTENYVQIGDGGNEVEIFEIIFKNDSLFVRTSEGVQSGSLDTNLLDFNNWVMYAGTSGYSDLTLVGNEIFAISASDLMRLANDTWLDTGVDLPAGSSKLFEVDNQLITSVLGTLYTYNGSEFLPQNTTLALNVNDLAIAGSSLVVADGELGLVEEGGNTLSPQGPLSDNFSNFRVINSQVFGFHAPSPFTYDGSDQVESFSLFSEGEWQERSIAGFGNVSDVARFNNNFYYSSIGDGIYDELNERVISDIPGSSSELDTIVTALASAQNLWVSSFGNSNPIHVMNSEQSWTSYTNVFLGESEYLTIDLSETGIGWLGSSSGVIIVLDSEENISDQITTADGLPSSFTDIDISIEDNAWIGTTRGPVIFPFASFIFSDSQGILPSFENRTLFEGEEITAVMTDGGNRIWFGTNQGLWVYDENTSEQVAVFNESNSPLPSNQIIQLAYDGITGEVFILTAKGMVSFRSSSSVGGRKHSDVNIFPNPVRPDYQGLVGLTGLANNANVKVTDVNGNLVKEIDANGGSASWNLLDINGSMIRTGIYLFFSSTSDGEETYVGKIAVVR